MSQLVCHACGARVTYEEPIPRDAECESCGADLRACRNCRHWDVHFNNECRETEAEPVADKARRNFCEFFDYSRGAFQEAGSSSSRSEEARARLDALFGGPKPGNPPGSSSDARSRLEALFKKGKASKETP